MPYWQLMICTYNAAVVYCAWQVRGAEVALLCKIGQCADIGVQTYLVSLGPMSHKGALFWLTIYANGKICMVTSEPAALWQYIIDIYKLTQVFICCWLGTFSTLAHAYWTIQRARQNGYACRPSVNDIVQGGKMNNENKERLQRESRRKVLGSLCRDNLYNWVL